jgi:hypothetical protein
VDNEKKSGIEQYDEAQIWRCPQLGGPVPFKYCRRMNDKLPCKRIIACWGGEIDVPAYLAASFSTEELEAVFEGPSKDRLFRIVDTLNKVREDKEGSTGETE